MAILTNTHKSFLLGLGVSAVILISFLAGGLADRLFVIRPLDVLLKRDAGPQMMNTTSPLSALVQDGQALSVADVAEKTSSSVVTVAIKKQQPVVQIPSILSPFFNSDPTMNQTEEIQRDIGTGFVIDSSGLVVTNKHVVLDTTATYTVIGTDETEYQVTKVYRDPVNDLAILKIEGAKIPALQLGDSGKIRVGETVIAIGTALGEFRHTVTTGVISGIGRSITAGTGFSQFEELENVIQTDAAINPGNSGGPLINARGEVIGVSVAVTANAQNIGFALPINIVKDSLDNFNKTGQFERPLLGVRYQMITEQAALANEVPQGAYVVAVVEGSTAAEIGLQNGDIVTKLDGVAIQGKDTLAKLMSKKKVGDSLNITYWRDREEKTIAVKLKVG
ncbi:trypsin-like peptidase domain-containing protein [Candidatus Woesebacteria bacterium]|nr:trypsin-like peptidase domain-containing protein [Candidatus Woesebacteria bacterium]